MESPFQMLKELFISNTADKNKVFKWRSVSGADSDFAPVEVVENESIDAFRKYLSENKDYRAAFQADAKRAHREISKAAQRRVAKKLLREAQNLRDYRSAKNRAVNALNSIEE